MRIRLVLIVTALATAVILAGIWLLRPRGAPAPPPAPRAASQEIPEDPAALRRLALEYFTWWFEDHPIAATWEGLHTRDDRMTDYSPRALQARRERIRSTLANVARVETAGWDDPGRTAHLLFRARLEGDLFEAEVIRRENRDPSLYVEECLDGVFSILRNPHGEPRERARAAWMRLRAMPALLDTGLRHLTDPIPALTRLALEMAEASETFFQEDLMVLVETLPAGDRTQFVEARDRALTSLSLYSEALAQRLPRRSAALGMGPKALQRMLERVYLVPLDASEITRIARTELERIGGMEADLQAVSRSDGGPTSGQRSRTRSPDGLTTEYGEWKERLRRHLRQRDLLLWPDDPGDERIARLPPALVPAHPDGLLRPPGLFDDAVPAYYAPLDPARGSTTSPHPTGEDLRPLLGHALIPGKLLWLSAARGHEDEIWRMHEDPVASEGWAHYMDGLLVETGFYSDSRELAAGTLRMMRLQAARSLAAVKLHAGHWTPEEAAGYLVAETGLDAGAAERLTALDAIRPGEAIGPVAGRWQIERLRDRYEEVKGKSAPLSRFHAELLARGAAPLSVAGQATTAAPGADPSSVAPEEGEMR